MDKAAVFGTADRGSIPFKGASDRAHSSMVEHLPLKETVEGSNPPALTKKVLRIMSYLIIFSL